MSLSQFFDDEKRKEEAQKNAKDEAAEKRRQEVEKFSNEVTSTVDSVIKPSVAKIIQQFNNQKANSAQMGQNLRSVTYAGPSTLLTALTVSHKNNFFLQIAILKNEPLLKIEFHFTYGAKQAPGTNLGGSVKEDKRYLSLGEVTLERMEKLIVEALKKFEPNGK